MRFKFTILLLFISSLCFGEMVLKNGDKITILHAKKTTPSVLFAVKELKNALSKTLNISSVIIDDSQSLPKDKLTFLVGPSKYSKLPNNMNYDHFIIKTGNKTIQLAGKDDDNDPLASHFMARTGSLYAVYQFMNDILKIRMLWPSESGVVYPKLKKVNIGDLNITNAPKFPIRTAYYGYGRLHGAKSNQLAVRWGRFNGMGSSILGSVGHASHRAIGYDYFKTHPEYYAIMQGKRKEPIGDRWKICHSNKDVAKIFAKWGVTNNRVAYANFTDYFPVSANDSSGWCECEECLALDNNQKSQFHNEICVSGRMFTFANRVAKEVKKLKSPKQVAIYAYSSYLDPPNNIERLEDNIIVFIARGISWNAAPKERKYMEKLFSAWSKKADSVVLRDYRNNATPMVIFPYPKLAYDTIQYLNKTFPKFKGINICGDDTRATALWGPTGYVYAKLLWNPNQKLEDILNDFYLNGWPKSNKYIREYFDFFEKQASDVIKKYNVQFFPWKAENDLYIAQDIMTQAAFEKGYKLLAKAKECANNSPEELDRIKFLKIGLDAVKVRQEYFTALMDVATFSGSLHGILPSKKDTKMIDKKQLLQVAKEKIVKHKEFFEKYKNHEGIPSAVLAYKKLPRDMGWNNTINELLQIYSKKSSTLILISDNWNFNIDPKKIGFKKEWFKKEFDDKSWGKITTNGGWEKQGFGADKYPQTKGYNGWGWYRRTVDIPKKWKKGNIILTLGAIDESFKLYINGKFVHAFEYNQKKDPSSWSKPQIIDITKYVSVGSNQITVAVHDSSGNGGIWKQSFLYWDKENLLPKNISDFNLKNVKVDGSIVTMTSKARGRIDTVILPKANSYTAKLAFKSLSDVSYYKIPVLIRIFFKAAQNKTLSKKAEGLIRRSSLQGNIGKTFRIEVNFDVPKNAKKIIPVLLLFNKEIEIISFKLEAN